MDRVLGDRYDGDLLTVLDKVKIGVDKYLECTNKRVILEQKGNLKKGDKVKLAGTAKRYERHGSLGVGTVLGRDRSGYAHYRVEFIVDGHPEEFFPRLSSESKIGHCRHRPEGAPA